MSREILIRCDRCHIAEQYDTARNWRTLTSMDIRPNGDDTIGSIELCPSCVLALECWLNPNSTDTSNA